MNKLYWTVQHGYATFDINEDYYFKHATESFITILKILLFDIKIEILSYE